MEYQILVHGLASTPHLITLVNITTGEIIHSISVARPTGKATRERYNKIIKILNKKYHEILG
jgi:hypothetical protein